MSEGDNKPRIEEMEYLKIRDSLKREFPDMLLQVKEPMTNFKKNTYEAAFLEYTEQYEEVLQHLEDVYIYTDIQEELLKSVAKEFVDAAAMEIERQPKKRRKDRLLSDYNMTMVVYVIPALQKKNPVSGKAYAEAILTEWKRQFPRTNLHAVTYEEIQEGFQQRYCYITTAVCLSLQKPDDCMELQLLREYRDGYLMDLEEGETVIKEYYDVAPTIVKHINRQSNASEIYRNIYDSYLSECIRLLQMGEKDACKQIYTDMVYDLEEKFFA
ncbi:MAG: hypothetical protein PUB25_03410 [Lachnospiraceae bacterium]|nr:hypothetical protein [Lachnospiraceae bacterium]